MHADILDPELYRTGDPHAVYAWLRREAPLYRDEKNDFWVASRYAEVVHVSKHPETFCSQHGVVPGSDTKVSMVTMDEPRHGRLRRLVNRGFTPRMVGMLEPRIRETVEASFDAVAEKGACDFVKDLAIPLPMIIIAELLGIPAGTARSRLHYALAGLRDALAADRAPERLAQEGRPA